MPPQLKIVSPVNSQTILGDKITVSFIVGDLRVGPEGHLHLWLDADWEKASPSAYLETHFDYTLSGLNPGEHKLALEVVRPDHQSFTPKVLQKVVFQTRTVLPTFPSPTIQKSELPAFFLDKTFIGLVFGLVIVVCGIFIRRMIKDTVD